MNLAAFVFSFVLVNLQTGARETVHPELSKQRTAPYSTYKIPHALIGLETGLLTGADHPMKWDGVQRMRDTWNQDQTLRSAMEYSTLWYFQRLATQLGRSREREWLARIRYGNARVDGDVTLFWLGGSLAISVDEQAELMRRLFTDALPFAKANLAIVRDILPATRGPHGVFRGKTGSDGRSICWFVGHVTHDGAQYVFATRVQEAGIERFTARTLTEKLLRERGLWIE
jgi:beta-lactamase class D